MFSRCIKAYNLWEVERNYHHCHLKSEALVVPNDDHSPILWAISWCHPNLKDFSFKKFHGPNGSRMPLQGPKPPKKNKNTGLATTLGGCLLDTRSIFTQYEASIAIWNHQMNLGMAFQKEMVFPASTHSSNNLHVYSPPKKKLTWKPSLCKFRFRWVFRTCKKKRCKNLRLGMVINFIVGVIYPL